MVTPESFLLFANPLPEPMILVSGGGFVLALNRACEQRFCDGVPGWRGKALADVVTDPPDEVARYLHLCSRSRQVVFGGLTVRGRDEVACRAEGSLLCPKTAGADAALMLRLVPKQAAAAQFLGLNLRIEELGREIQRRKAAEQVARENSERLRTTLASIGDGVIATDIDGRVTSMNPVAESLTGWKNDEAAGVPLIDVFNIVNETTRRPVENPAERALREGTVVGLANHTILIAKDGTERPIDDSAAPIRTAEGRVVGSVLVFRDVTERRQEESLLANQSRVLEQVVRGDPLTEVLDALCLTVERHVGAGLIATILLTDEGGTLLRPVAGRRCPDAYSAAINPVPVGPGIGSCGTAAYRGKLVVVADIATDPLWADYRHVALPHGLKACWSVPILSSAGSVLGTFAVYSPSPRRPSDRDLWVVEFLARTAGIAIERKRAEESLRFQHDLTKSITDTATTAIFMMDDRSRCTFMNPAAEAMTGYTFAEVRGGILHDFIHHHHPDGRPYPMPECPIDRALPEHGEVRDHEDVFVRKNGEFFPVLVNARVIYKQDAAVGTVIEVRDITVRKRAEAALRESEERFRGIFTQTLAGIAETDLAGRFVQVNPRYCEMVGRSAEQLSALRIQDVTHPDDLSRNLALFEKAVSEGTPFVVEKRYVRPDRSFVWVSNSVSLVRDGQGRPKRIVAASLDITERKRAEEQLADALRFYHSSIDALSSHIAVLDENGVILEVNDAWRRFADMNHFTGFNCGVGVNYIQVCESSSGECADDGSIERGIRDVLDGRRPVFESEYPCHSPTEDRWYLIRVTRFQSPGPVRVVVSHDNVTRRRVAEEQLRASNVRLLGILQQSPAGIVQTDAAGRMTLVNERWCQMLGYAAADLLGKSVLEITHPSSVAATAEAVTRLAAGGPDFQIEKNYCRKDGSLLSAQSNVTAVRSPEGAFQGLIAVVLDMTERLRIEEELRRVASELSDADRRKNEFLATLAHELRNPLAPIRNGLQLIQLARGDWATVEKARTLIDRQLNQMVRLVDDLMDVSRISTGKVQLRKERVTLASVVQSAVETSRPLIEQMGHDLTVTLPERPLVLEVDQTRVAQVFLNLLNNAAKYSERNGRIWLTAEQQGSEVVVSVKDAGIGIPPDHLPRVFEMFSQVDRSLEKSQGGLGIGLCLVKRLVELHGGKIEARSDGPGEGAEFVVRLPVVVESSAPAEEVRSPEEDKSALRILIVDDNRDSADSLAMMLEMMGNQTCTAYDGEEAVTAADRFRPEVILLDIGLPKLNGYEACRRIRGLESGTDMVIMAQTGWGQQEDRQRTHEAGFDHHLVKPVDPKALMRLLRSLSKHEDRQLTRRCS